MKLVGYFFKETELARLIGPDESDSPQAVWVPQDRTTMFRKLPYKERGVSEYPRRCIFTVEGWLQAKPEFKVFREAVFAVDYI
jgi:hypothetical protein